MPDKPPTSRQLQYLRALAERTGQTFSWPTTRGQASREIARLKRTRPSSRAERELERVGDTQAIEAAQDAVAVQSFEVLGFGSSATWSQRS